MSQPRPVHGEEPTHGRIEIRVEGQLAPRWSAWLDGLTVTAEGGTTLIHGPIADQAAAFGVLQRLRDLAVPLISVDVLVDPPTPPKPPASGGEGSSS